MGRMTLIAVAAGLITLSTIYGASALKSALKEKEPARTLENSAAQSINETASLNSAIDAANERRRIDLETKREEARLELAKRKKLESNECKFWTLQNQNHASEKTAEKIVQYCNL